MKVLLSALFLFVSSTSIAQVGGRGGGDGIGVVKVYGSMIYLDLLEHADLLPEVSREEFKKGLEFTLVPQPDQRPLDSQGNPHDLVADLNTHSIEVYLPALSQIASKEIALITDITHEYVRAAGKGTIEDPRGGKVKGVTQGYVLAQKYMAWLTKNLTTSHTGVVQSLAVQEFRLLQTLNHETLRCEMKNGSDLFHIDATQNKDSSIDIGMVPFLAQVLNVAGVGAPDASLRLVDLMMGFETILIQFRNFSFSTLNMNSGNLKSITLTLPKFSATTEVVPGCVVGSTIKNGNEIQPVLCCLGTSDQFLNANIGLLKNN